MLGSRLRVWQIAAKPSSAQQHYLNLTFPGIFHSKSTNYPPLG